MTDGNRVRQADVRRTTAETDIALSLELGGSGEFDGSTGIGFFDHMLTLFARHGRMRLRIECTGDLQVDSHHTVEDIGICLGEALGEALGDKSGIVRYGAAYVPMDECLARAVVDLSGRSACVIDAQTAADRAGGFDVELAWEFFHALARSGRLTLHIDLLRSGNAHHAVEACFKAAARALADACRIDPEASGVPSTKGTL